MQEVVLFYNGLDVPTRQILDSRGAIPSKIVADAKVVIQEMAEYSQKWHNGTSRTKSTETFDGLAAIQAQLNNLGREIKKVNEKVYAAQVGCKQCKGPHYTKECPLKKEGKTLEDAYYTQFGAPFQGGDIEQLHQNSIKGTTRILRAIISVMPFSTYLNFGLGELAHTKLTVELADSRVKYPKGIAEIVLVVLDDMDAYHDEGIGDVIFGELFLREVGINAKRFKGMITIHIGNEEVTYQMARSHPRFKNHTNEQCNKISPLLKDLTERKEIDNVSGESTIWKSGSVRVLKS
ncbi:putative reverse transcriptase domain-containing protein [Tanacetum coccineum]